MNDDGRDDFVVSAAHCCEVFLINPAHKLIMLGLRTKWSWYSSSAFCTNNIIHESFNYNLIDLFVDLWFNLESMENNRCSMENNRFIIRRIQRTSWDEWHQWFRRVWPEYWRDFLRYSSRLWLQFLRRFRLIWRARNTLWHLSHQNKKCQRRNTAERWDWSLGNL